MVKFGSYTLPHVLTIRETYSRIRQEVPLPGRSWAYRKDRGGLGGQITLSGEIRADVEQTRDEIAALADGVARILDYESPDLIALEATLRYQAGPIWTDDTAEAKTPAAPKTETKKPSKKAVKAEKAAKEVAAKEKVKEEPAEKPAERPEEKPAEEEKKG